MSVTRRRLRSPIKSPVKSRLSLPMPSTPSRSGMTAKMSKMTLRSTPKRKYEDVNVMDTDAAQEELLLPPSKRSRTRGNETAEPVLDNTSHRQISPSVHSELHNATAMYVDSRPQNETPALAQLTRSTHQNQLVTSLAQQLPEGIRTTTESRNSAGPQLPHELPSENVIEENTRVSPTKSSSRQIPLCGTRREVFLDRKPWLEIDSRMQKHLARFQLFLQSVEHPRIL